VANIAEPIGAVDPFGGGEGLCHWASRADRNRHIVESAEFKEPQRICSGKVGGDIAVDDPYGNQLRIWPPSEEEHCDRIITPNIRVQENLCPVHRWSLCRVRALRIEAFQDQ
jgi:hypothetical protein